MEDEYYKTVEVIFDDINFTILNDGHLGFMWDDIKEIVSGCNKNGFIGKDNFSRNIDEFNYEIDITASVDSKLILKVIGYFD